MPDVPDAVIADLPSGSARGWAMALWAAIFVGLPLLVASLSVPIPTPRGGATPVHHLAIRPPSPPPAVEPLEVLKIAPVEARAINAAVPFSTAPNPAARPFLFAGNADDRARATDCLAAAQYYEAGDDASGQEAVAQVIINRMRHPAFPKSICGVVFQGAERATGCQFTFTCDGALTREPTPAGWDRARTLAARMLAGKVDSRVGLATHYHTDWLVPYWSSSLDKITEVHTHLFFRWKGWWGTPPAFRRAQNGAEPAITQLASLSPIHAAGSARMASIPSTITSTKLPDFSDLASPAIVIGRESIGNRFGAARLAAINSTGDAFVMLIDRGATPGALEQLARQICGGRTKCRLLGWTSASDAPSGFPIAEEKLATMSYAYMRATDAGLERSLYNCTEFPGQPKMRCMRNRIPLAAPSVSVAPPPRSGTETIHLKP